MDRTLGQFWPRARSKLYEEPKKLVAHGLAKATRRAWASVPAPCTRSREGTPGTGRVGAERGPGPGLEFEQLIKVFFAEHGTRDGLLATLAGLRRWREDQAELGAEISGGYLSGDGPFPDRLPWIILCGEFLERFDDMVDEWAAWAIGVVEQWPDDIRDTEPDIETLRGMAANNEQIARRRSVE